MTTTIHCKESRIIDPEKTQVLMLDKDSCVRLIQDLAESLAQTGTGRLVLRTEDDRYLIFKLYR